MPRRRLTTRNLRSPVRLASVRLEAVGVGVERPNPDWIQIAAEGDYRGYGGGEKPFAFDEAIFNVIVRNLHNHPAYVRAGGPTDVVAFDFSHASEGDPADIAVDGAPAQAWVQELEVRRGDMGVELWALTRFLEPMLSYRAQGRYKWTSVCVWPDQVDPVSGESIGWVLSSVAFTNDPFIQGMVPIAASRGFDPFCPPRTPAEVLDALRHLFGLPEMAGPELVMTSLIQLRGYAMGAATPAGVDVDALVGELRMIFNLPTLASVADVFTQADALLVALGEAATVSTIAATRKDPAPMDHNQTAVIALAARLRVSLPEKPEKLSAILLEAVDGAIAEAKSGTAKADADLQAMLEALGEQDVTGGMKRIADMIQQSARLKAVLPSLAAYEKSQEESETKSVEEDVAMAASFHFKGSEQKARAVLLHMRTPPKGADAAERARVREAFLAAYPPPTAETLALTTNLTGGAAAVAASNRKAGQDGPPALPNGKVPTVADLNACKGPNPNAKAIELVRSNGGENLTHDQRFTLAVKIRRALEKTTGAAPASL